MANVLVRESSLEAIADAIREKLNTENTYKPGEMANAIESIGGGSTPVINSLSVTENGTYTAPSGVDGYSPVTVNVPQGSTPTGTKQISITENGTTMEDVTDYASTEITVNVPSSGGTVSGSFTPESNLRSVTLPDCIGKSNILIYPTTPLATISAGRTHYGDLITAASGTRMVGSTNSGGTSWTLGLSTASSWDSTTGTITITAGTTANYGGYYAYGMTYAYVAW